MTISSTLPNTEQFEVFVPLPTSMEQLEAAVQKLGHSGIAAPPPNLMEIGKRLRQIYETARRDGYSSLGRSEIRKLPYAYWVGNDPGLTWIEPELVRRYWTHYLPEALQASPRRAKRWLMPLLFVYCEQFALHRDFLTYAQNVVACLRATEWPVTQKFYSLQSQYSFFNPLEAPRRLAEYFFREKELSLDTQLTDLSLWSGFCASSLGSAVFDAGLSFSDMFLRDAQTVRRILKWEALGAGRVVKTSLRVRFADALLGCWSGYIPDETLRKELINFFLEQYGDPRFPAHRHYQWEGVSDRAKHVLLNWLTGDTLRAFIELLQRTADDIWRYREKFWMAYYDQGYIDEAWIALGDDALGIAKRLKLDEQGMGYAHLEGGATRSQSVLLLKIGGLVFTEWSHNGALRAYLEASPDAPTLYRNAYHGAELRARPSLDFHDAANAKPELTHANSDKGSWQRKARDFIRRHTGIHLGDREILL